LAPTTDFFIAGLLVWFLRSSRTGFKKTDTMLNKLSKLTIQTGAITGFCAVLGLLLFLAIPNFIHLLFIFTLPEIYGVCLMSSLNARSSWSAELTGDQSFHWKSQNQKQSSSDGGRGVHITTTTVTHNDLYELNTRNGAAISMQQQSRTYGNPVSNIPVMDIDLKRGAGDSQSNVDVEVKKKYIADDGLSLKSEDRSSLDVDIEAGEDGSPAGRGRGARQNDRVDWRNAL